MSCDVGEASQLIVQSLLRFTYVTAHSTALPMLHLLHSSLYNPSAASPMSQVILQPFRRFTYVTGHSKTLLLLHLHHRYFTYFTWRAAHAQRDEKNSMWWTSLLLQVTKFRSSYSFGQLLRILLLAVNLFSFSHTVSSGRSFNIHNALYFVKYPSRAAQNSPEGRGLKTPVLEHPSAGSSFLANGPANFFSSSLSDPVLFFLLPFSHSFQQSCIFLFCLSTLDAPSLSIPTSQMLPVVFAHSAIVSRSLHHTTLHSTQNTSLVSSVVLFTRARGKCFFFSVKGFFCHCYPINQWEPTRGTRATSDTRMLSERHTQSHYI